MADHVEIWFYKADETGCCLEIRTNRIWCDCYNYTKPCCTGMNGDNRNIFMDGDWIYLSWYGPIIELDELSSLCLQPDPPGPMALAFFDNQLAVNDQGFTFPNADGSVSFVSKNSHGTLPHLTEKMSHVDDVYCAEDTYAMPEKLDTIRTKFIHMLHINAFSQAELSFQNKFLATINDDSSLVIPRQPIYIPRNIHIREMRLCCNHTYMKGFINNLHKKFDRLVIYPKNFTNGKVCGTCLMCAQYLARTPSFGGITTAQLVGTYEVIIVESLKYRNTLVKIIRHVILLHYLVAKN